MSVLTKKWAALVGLAVVAASSGAAQALPQFTFTPSAAGLGGTSATSFTADNIQISDYSTITLTNTATPGVQTFTDNGTLSVSNFMLGSGAALTPVGLNSTYGLYFNFMATGTQTVTSPGNASGTISQINFTLNGYNRNPNDSITYLPGNTTPLDGSTAVTPIELAAGTGTGYVADLGGSPSATASTTFTVYPPALGFFASPTPFYNMALAAFINTGSELLQTNDPNLIVINAGGGTVNFATQSTPVPEPRSLMLLGAGLAAVGLIRRGKRA